MVSVIDPKLIGPKTKKGQGTVDKRFPGGMAPYFDDSWLPLLQQIQGGAGLGDVFSSILSNFKGSEKDLSRWMRTAAPFIAASTAMSPAYEYSQDFMKNTDLMQAYGTGAGQIAQGASQGLRQAQNQLGSMGLGRSSAMAGLASQSAMGAANAQAGLYTNLYQQQQQQRLMGARMAFDQQQQLARLALGMTPGPRQKQGGSNIGGAIAGALGTAVGGLLGGPLLGGATGAVTNQYFGGGRFGQGT